MTWTRRILLLNTFPPYQHEHPRNELEEGGVEGQNTTAMTPMTPGVTPAIL